MNAPRSVLVVFLIIDRGACIQDRQDFCLLWKWTTGVVSIPLISHLRADTSTKLSVPCRIHRDLAHLRRHFRPGKQNASRRVASTGKTTRFTRNFRNKSTTEMRKQFLSSTHRDVRRDQS